LSVMYDVNVLKYQNPELQQLLLATGNKILVEANWWGDTFWGECGHFGFNNLGKTLMRIRAEILKEQDDSKT